MDTHHHKGTLKRWNEEKGFGFIDPGEGGRDIFIHISALKRMSRRPVVGDVITYQVHADNDGRKRAVNAGIEGVAAVTPAQRHKHLGQRRVSRWIPRIMLAVLVAAIGAVVYTKYAKTSHQEIRSGASGSIFGAGRQHGQSYTCSGKMYCSEMNSCEEAMFYQNNCPDTKMDGDGDGIPCESQWCGR